MTRPTPTAASAGPRAPGPSSARSVPVTRTSTCSPTTRRPTGCGRSGATRGWPACRGQGRVRPGEPVPVQPQHRSGGDAMSSGVMSSSIIANPDTYVDGVPHAAVRRAPEPRAGGLGRGATDRQLAGRARLLGGAAPRGGRAGPAQSPDLLLQRGPHPDLRRSAAGQGGASPNDDQHGSARAHPTAGAAHQRHSPRGRSRCSRSASPPGPRSWWPRLPTGRRSTSPAMSRPNCRCSRWPRRSACRSRTGG